MIKENISLKPYNTFGIEATAKQFVTYSHNKQLPEVINHIKANLSDFFILGGGSNVLFRGDYNGLIVHPQTKGIDIVQRKGFSVRVRAQAGEVWDDFVAWAVKNNFSGVENLSAIPGSVGASVVQNIGAYGIEVKDVVSKVEAIDIETGKMVELSQAECEFGYRHSAFKSKYKDRLLVVSVEFELSTLMNARLSYSGLKEAVYALGVANLKNIRSAITSIRNAKLPDPKTIGNAGSFFKNPIIPQHKATELQMQYPSIPLYPASEGFVKVAAGWLIDQCGWKAYREGEAGVHTQQALVLVNYGGATGQNIIDLSDKICKSVFERFAIEINPEVIFV